MKVQVIVTDSAGTVFEGEAVLAPKGQAPKVSRQASRAAPVAKSSSPVTLDFDLPVRAFVKRYARGLSGPKRFAVLVAKLTGGKIDRPFRQRRSRSSGT
jgi:hypothetical protein